MGGSKLSKWRDKDSVFNMIMIARLAELYISLTYHYALLVRYLLILHYYSVKFLKPYKVLYIIHRICLLMIPLTNIYKRALYWSVWLRLVCRNLIHRYFILMCYMTHHSAYEIRALIYNLCFRRDMRVDKRFLRALQLSFMMLLAWVAPPLNIW